MPPLTHFLCFPLVTSTSRLQLEQSLEKFQSAISNPPEALKQTSLDTNDITSPKGAAQQPHSLSLPQLALSAKAIRPIGTLHLTLGVMSLETEERIQGAIDLLQNLDPLKLLKDAIAQSDTDRDFTANDIPNIISEEANISTASSLTSLSQPISPPPTSRPPASLSTNSTHEPIIISLTSLISMHAPTKTSILYAAPQDPSNRLLPLSQRLRTVFEEKEYTAKDTRPLKLHATIVNTIYAKAGGRYGRAKPMKPRPLTSQPEASSQPEPTTDPTGDADEPNDDPDRVEEESKPEDRSSGRGPSARAPLRFDATALIEQFKEFVWARDFRVEKIAICKMGAKKILDEKGDVVGEEYEEVASIGLP